MKTPGSLQRTPITQRPTREGIDAKTSKKADKAEKADQVRNVRIVDKLDSEDEISQVGTRPSKTSPLAEAVLQGLEELANKYYGGVGNNALSGIDILARSAGSGQADTVVSKEFLDLRARSLSKEVPELGTDKARELLTNIAQLLAT
ncbi:MAG: hypothetical protein HY791_40130 [Deltaproteobacteria bacterium]|nr:hypothetical protein [Deltaproteobacteria bacterium]